MIRTETLKCRCYGCGKRFESDAAVMVDNEHVCPYCKHVYYVEEIDIYKSIRTLGRVKIQVLNGYVCIPIEGNKVYCPYAHKMIAIDDCDGCDSGCVANGTASCYVKHNPVFNPDGITSVDYGVIEI